MAETPVVDPAAERVDAAAADREVEKVVGVADTVPAAGREEKEEEIEEGSSEAAVELKVQLVTLSGAVSEEVGVAMRCTVADLRSKLSGGSVPPGTRRMLIFEDQMLESPTQELGSLLSDGARDLVLRSIIQPSPVDFDLAQVCGVQVLDDGMTVRRGDGEGGGGGWGSVRAKSPLPRGLELSWRIVVEGVAFCGDVIVGVEHREAPEGPEGQAYCFVVVGRPSGLLAVNPDRQNFGGGTTDRMLCQHRDYSHEILFNEGKGTDILATWSGESLSFQVNGVDCGVAFHNKSACSDSSLPPLPDEGLLFPFVTMYGSDTQVAIRR